MWIKNSVIKTVRIISDSRRTIPNQLRKFAKYKGFLKTEYIPEVFKLSAICFAVFFPDVLWKAYPTAYTLRIKPEIEIDSDSKYWNWVIS